MRLTKPTVAQLGLTPEEGRILRTLRTPERIQQFVVDLHANFEEDGDSLRSVRGVLRHRKAHCIEAAFIAACALWLQGERPLLMDMTAQGDSDHVVALFKRDGCWGAISKSNHVWLRWRDPVYRSLRELAISYLHEYSDGDRKTLRGYSVPFDLRRFSTDLWVTNEDHCWDVGAALDDVRHYRLITPKQARRLMPRDATELRANDLVQYESVDRVTARKY
ncbi:hypothetical protein SAMN02745126_03120 [Enhydrobacter aerosaccus]|uniref:Transglutaminase-like superfamily protein n=1 Tax=Enhydrobacter aerosaccus TaxID=225324 RepID=A0A1T4QBQ5_9HYPH|nr:hypothetical protein [Enhydrobacter aerosaccus]SKA01057.1 hypothetical protein SAMN02745126_03120 [Enhydrobacter aerosaccus]